VIGPPPDDRFAARLRGFGPVGVLATLAVLAAGAVLGPFKALPVLLWAWRSRTPWRELGFVRPAIWARTVVIGIVAGAAFKLAMKSVVMPLLGAPPANAAFQFLVGNTAAIPVMLVEILVGAGFGEEVVFRGYLFERIRHLLGPGVGVRVAAVVFTSVLFAAAHIPMQGLSGAEQALVTGLVFGTFYAVTGRIVGVMIAHAAFDLAAVAIIYWNLETTVAHWFFR
jgi:membrane protease YdiL (CAAX protease family)